MSRMTKQREAILEAFERLERPLAPQEVLDEAQGEVPQLGLSTVYRTLRWLEQRELIAAVQMPGEADRYELKRVADRHHHHFHCTECSKVFDVHGCPSGLGKLVPEGFMLTGHEITLRGLCDECAARDDGDAGAEPQAN